MRKQPGLLGFCWGAGGESLPISDHKKGRNEDKNPLCCFWLSLLRAVAESWVNLPPLYNLTRNVGLMRSQLLRRFMVAVQLECGSKCYKISACVRPIDPTPPTRRYFMHYKHEFGSFNKMYLHDKNWRKSELLDQCHRDRLQKDDTPSAQESVASSSF